MTYRLVAFLTLATDPCTFPPRPHIQTGGQQLGPREEFQGSLFVYDLEAHDDGDAETAIVGGMDHGERQRGRPEEISFLSA